MLRRRPKDHEPLLSYPPDEEANADKLGAYRKEQLRQLYHVTDAMILGKVYQIAPWKATFVKAARWPNKLMFPLKFLCHVSLVALLCSLLSCDNYQWGAYQRSAAALSCRFFYPSDLCELDGCLGYLSSITPSLDAFQCDVYQRNQVKAAMVSAMDNYYLLPNTSLAVLSTSQGVPSGCVPDDHIHTAQLTVSLDGGGSSAYPLEAVAADDYALLDALLRPAALQQTQHFKLSLPVEDTLVTDMYSGRMLWVYEVLYTFSSQVQFRVEGSQRIAQICDMTTKQQAGPAASSRTSLQSLQHAVHVLAQVVIAVSAVYLLLLLIEVTDNLRLYYYAMDVFSAAEPAVGWRRWFSSIVRAVLFIPASGTATHSPSAGQTVEKDGETHFLAPAALYGSDDNRSARRLIAQWPHLQVKIKSRLFDGWRLLALAALLINIYACSLFLDVRKGYYLVYFHGLAPDSHRVLLGFSTALLCFSLLNYFRYSNRFTGSSLVLWGAFFKVQRLLVSILPVAVGMVFLGIMVFGHSSERFGDIGAIIVTIFSVMNCDSIWKTFVDTTGTNTPAFVGTLYVTLIFIIFSYLTLRVILAMVESLYFYLRLYTSSRRKRTQFRRMALNSALSSKHVLDTQSSSLTQLEMRGTAQRPCQCPCILPIADCCSALQ